MKNGLRVVAVSIAGLLGLSHYASFEQGRRIGRSDVNSVQSVDDAITRAARISLGSDDETILRELERRRDQAILRGVEQSRIDDPNFRAYIQSVRTRW